MDLGEMRYTRFPPNVLHNQYQIFFRKGPCLQKQTKSNLLIYAIEYRIAIGFPATYL